jgi:hypothetical protein
MKSRAGLSVALTSVILLVVSLGWAAPKPPKTSPQDIPPFPGTLVNARYVYVASYDGDQFDPNLLPEDRQAISTVQDAMQKWGKFIVVYEPRQADVILMVTSRPSEDILAVYDGRGPKDQYLWRMMGRSGLQPSETPLIANLEKAFEKATAGK